MNTLIWIVGTTWVGVIVWTIRTAIGDLRFNKAQIRAYQQWDRTGRIVPGWSPQWRWSHPRDVDIPTGITKVINQFFVTVNQVINVTQVNIRALILPGGAGGVGGVAGDATSGATEAVGKVIPGTLVPDALPEAGQRVGSVLGNALDAIRSNRDAA